MVGMVLGLVCLVTSFTLLLSYGFMGGKSRVPAFMLLAVGLLTITVAIHQIRAARLKDNTTLCEAYIKQRQGKLIDGVCYLKVGDNLWMGGGIQDRRFLTDEEIESAK